MPTEEQRPWDESWETLGPIGASTHGNTLLVQHRESGQKGVLKRLQPGRNPYTPNSMAREIVNLDSLFNAGCRVPKVLDKNTNTAGAREGELYFVREYIEGDSLRTRIDQSGPWKGGEIGAMLDSLTRSLRQAFAQTIVHGDIRPENIIPSTENESDFVILNYGVTFDRSARSILRDTESRETTVFLELPESVLGSVDERSDITALVGVAFFALTAKVPVRLVGSGGRAPHLQDPQCLEGCFDSPTATIAAHAFFEQGFARQPDDRFQTLNEFMSSWHRVVPPPIAPEDSLLPRR